MAVEPRAPGIDKPLLLSADLLRELGSCIGQLEGRGLGLQQVAPGPSARDVGTLKV